MVIMVAFAIVSTMALGIAAGYLAILGILRLFSPRTRGPRGAELQPIQSAARV